VIAPYEHERALQRASGALPDLVVFQTSTVPFVVRGVLPDTDLDSSQPRLGVSLPLQADDAQALHDQLKKRGVPILVDPFDTPFGRIDVFSGPEGYVVAIHGSDQRLSAGTL
jgi:predicted enzyme related to lactoylglutathione lyase